MNNKTLKNCELEFYHIFVFCVRILTSINEVMNTLYVHSYKFRIVYICVRGRGGSVVDLGTSEREVGG